MSRPCCRNLPVLIAELLSTDGCLIHEAGLIHGEDGHPVGEFGVGAGPGFQRDGGGLTVIISLPEGRE